MAIAENAAGGAQGYENNSMQKIITKVIYKFHYEHIFDLCTISLYPHLEGI